MIENPDDKIKKRVLVIDGMYLIFSSFYVFSNMRSASGFPTGAVYGFITRIENLISELNPDFLIVAMDSKGKTFRHTLYPEYKSKRKEAPEELKKQIPIVKNYLKVKGIDIVELAGFEGDDIISFYKNEIDENTELVIFTADKDMFQLVDENTRIYHPKLKILLGRDGIKAHYGMFPNQIVDFLSLMGDSSDNIPGAKGIGEKTAKKLIEQYGSLENIFKNIDTVEEKYKKKLKASIDNINLSKRLILLNAEKPEWFNLSMREFKNLYSRELAFFYKKYSFKSLLKKIKELLKSQARDNNINYKFILTEKDLIELKKKILEQEYFAFDLETTGLSFYNSEIVGVSISFTQEGYYIPLKAPDLNSSLDIKKVKNVLGELFTDSKIDKSGFNIKFDMLFLKNEGIETIGFLDDAMIMSSLLYPNRRSHKLKDLSFEYLKDINQLSFEDITGNGKNKKSIEEIDYKIVGRYCIDDSNISLQLIQLFKEEMEINKLQNLYNKIETPLIPVLTDMEYEGIKIDVKRLKEYIAKLSKKIIEIEREIISQAGFELNINSPKQLGELLFEKMKLPISKKTKKTRAYSTDIEVLTEYKNVPIVANIIKYRKLNKLYSTYLLGIRESINPNNRRIHTSFNQTITATGRLSSSKPNLQNIPVFETDEINIRKLFISDEGKKLLAADYSQIELRVMAYFSNDKNLISAFENGMDIHSHTADMVFGNMPFLDKKLKRKRAKIINFSIIYGSGPYSLSKELEVSYSEAKSFIETYFEKYSGVKNFIEETVLETEKNGFVRTMNNRKRNIPEINSTVSNIKENGKRMAVNTIIQGSAAEIMKIAMINIHKRIKNMNSKMLLSVHDEIIFEYPVNEESELIEIVSYEMKNAVKLSVPLEISIKKGENWGEMVDVME